MSITSLLFGAAAGAAAAWFLDPDRGRARRATFRDRGTAAARRGGRAAASQATSAAQRAKGAAREASPIGGHDTEKLDDVALARKVETEIFRSADAPKGRVSVNAENGVVFLRGAVDDPAWIERFGEEAGKVEGVEHVRNLLHLPGEPAQT